jgi:exodeoxyribonuclease-3
MPFRAGRWGGPLHFLGLPGRCGPKNNGIRIDHVLLSPQAADRLTRVTIDRHVRGWDKPSDHVPVVVDLAID